MRFKSVLLALVAGCLLPWVLFSGIHPEREEPTTQNPTSVETTAETPTELTVQILLQNGSIAHLSLETYITGVVIGEMPAEFHEQALKAQAVVARTVACRCLYYPGKHEGFHVCTDASCCQAFMFPEEYMEQGASPLDMEKIRDAVNDTAGQVVTYNGSLADVTYFSCSGGRTEDALAVWGADIPYLQATDSPGEEDAYYYMDTVTFSAEDFRKLLDLELGVIHVDQVTYTRGGGVDCVIINGKEYTGLELRKYLNLRSTAFVLTALGDTVTVTTKGNGHRVGMSQFGAHAMAQNSSNYREILAHYYLGTTVANITELFP